MLAALSAACVAYNAYMTNAVYMSYFYGYIATTY